MRYMGRMEENILPAYGLYEFSVLKYMHNEFHFGGENKYEQKNQDRGG